MYAILIIDAVGNVREWSRGSQRYCRDLAKLLPNNGWTLHSIVQL